ncbi:MAG: hypothetical protein IPO92_16520 [Saprospiraceae bacterium]|nr:hypothetical protein [Saprospiraceae bacterium]
MWVNGNGLENTNVVTMNNDATLYISGTSQSSVHNLSGGNLTIGSNNRLDMNEAKENTLYN